MTFARQSLGSFAALIFGVMVSILLPRILGPEARGEYQLAVKLAGLVLAVAQWGIPEVYSDAGGRARASGSHRTSCPRAVAPPVAALLGLAAPLFKDNLLRCLTRCSLATLGGSIASLVSLLFSLHPARRATRVYNGLDVGRNVLFLALAWWAAPAPARRSADLAWLIGRLSGDRLTAL